MLVHVSCALAALAIAALATLGGARDANGHAFTPGRCDRVAAAAAPEIRAQVGARCRAFVREHVREHRRHASARPAVASCYADWTDGFAGQTTASGATVTLSSRFVAHRTAPLGSRVVVYANGRRVVAKVADRGPYARNANGEYSREFDVAYGVARRLGFASCAAFGVRTIRVARY